jgi:hypothetical protein
MNEELPAPAASLDQLRTFELHLGINEQPLAPPAAPPLPAPSLEPPPLPSQPPPSPALWQNF